MKTTPSRNLPAIIPYLRAYTLLPSVPPFPLAPIFQLFSGSFSPQKRPQTGAVEPHVADGRAAHPGGQWQPGYSPVFTAFTPCPVSKRGASKANISKVSFHYRVSLPTLLFPYALHSPVLPSSALLSLSFLLLLSYPPHSFHYLPANRVLLASRPSPTFPSPILTFLRFD